MSRETNTIQNIIKDEEVASYCSTLFPYEDPRGRFQRILVGLVINRKLFGNEIARIQAWSDLHKRLDDLLQENIKQGQPLSEEQVNLLATLERAIAYTPPVEDSSSYDDSKRMPSADIAETLLTENCPYNVSQSNENITIEDKVFMGIPELSFQSDQNSYKEWQNYRAQQRRMKEYQFLINTLIEPTRYSWGYTLTFISIILLVTIGAVLTVIGPWAALIPFAGACLISIPTLITNMALSDRFLLSLAHCLKELSLLSGLLKTYQNNKVAQGTVLLAIILATFITLCSATVAGFLTYGGCLLLLGVLPFTLSAMAFIIINSILIVSTALFLSVLVMPGFLKILTRFIKKLFDKSNEQNNQNKEHLFNKKNLIYLTAPSFLLGSGLMHYAGYIAIASLLGPTPAIIICVLSFTANSSFVVSSGVRSIKKYWGRLPFPFVCKLIKALWNASFTQAKKTGLLNKLLYIAGPISCVVFALLAFPLFFIASVLVFIIKRASNSDELLELWLIERARLVQKNIPSLTAPFKIAYLLFVGIPYFFLVFLPTILISTLVFRDPCSPDRVWSSIKKWHQRIKGEWKTAKQSQNKAAFFAQKVGWAMLYAVAIPIAIAINTLLLLWGILLQLAFFWKETQNALNNGIPGLVAILNSGAAHVGNLILGGVGFISASFNSLSVMSQNTFLENTAITTQHLDSTESLDQYSDTKQTLSFRILGSSKKTDTEKPTKL